MEIGGLEFVLKQYFVHLVFWETSFGKGIRNQGRRNSKNGTDAKRSRFCRRISESESVPVFCVSCGYSGLVTCLLNQCLLRGTALPVCEAA